MDIHMMNMPSLKKDVTEWDDKDEALLDKKYTEYKIKIGLDSLKKDVTDWDEKDDKKMEEMRSKLPKNVVVLSKESTHIQPPDTKPLKYTVKKGDTLKKIAEMYSLDYGELVNYLMAVNGSTAIVEGVDIEIPRHFIDLSQA